MANYALMGALAGGLQGLGQGVDRAFQYKMEEARHNSLLEIENRKLGIAETEAQNQKEYRDETIGIQKEQNRLQGEAQMDAALAASNEYLARLRELRVQEGSAEAEKIYRQMMLEQQEAQTGIAKSEQEASEITRRMDAFTKFRDGVREDIDDALGSKEMSPSAWRLLGEAVETYGSVEEAVKELEAQGLWTEADRATVNMDRLTSLYEGIKHSYASTVGLYPNAPPLTNEIIRQQFPRLSAFLTPPTSATKSAGAPAPGTGAGPTVPIDPNSWEGIGGDPQASRSSFPGPLMGSPWAGV